MQGSGARVLLPLWTGINGKDIGGYLDLPLTTIRPCYALLREELTKTCANSYKLVWSATQKLYADMIASEGWAATATIDVPCLQQLTFKVGVLVQPLVVLVIVTKRL
jgi:hypothetical protein